MFYAFIKTNNHVYLARYWFIPICNKSHTIIHVVFFDLALNKNISKTF